MKKVTVFLLAAAFLLGMAGCSDSCEHVWAEADCIIPKTCTECGETEGTPLGHEWNDATCTTAQVCARCGRTEGDPLGHSWVEATCTEAKHCTGCGEVIGEALGHVWTEATTEAPKTCTVCAETEGEKIQADPRFVTADAQHLFGRWEAKVRFTEEDLEIRRYNGTLEGTYWVEFGKDGVMKAGLDLKDEEAFRKAVAEAYADWAFEALEEKEVDEKEADAVAEELLGMGVEAYILSTQQEQPIGELIEELMEKSRYGNGWTGEFVYYVSDDQLYLETEWKEEMRAEECEFIGSTLMLFGFLECKAVTTANGS